MSRASRAWVWIAASPVYAGTTAPRAWAGPTHVLSRRREPDLWKELGAACMRDAACVCGAWWSGEVIRLRREVAAGAPCDFNKPNQTTQKSAALALGEVDWIHGSAGPPPS